MRGAPKSTLTDEQRLAARREATFLNYARHAVPNRARGLSANGTTNRRGKPLSPRMQKLVDEYKVRMAEQQAEPEVPMSAVEIEWRKLRADMGDITVPDAEVKQRY